MANAISKQIGQTVVAAADFTNPDGTPGAVVGTPVWTSDNLLVWNPAVAPGNISADGLTATGPILSVGVANVTCVGQGDPTPGADAVTLTAVITGVAQEISGGSLALS